MFMSFPKPLCTQGQAPVRPEGMLSGDMHYLQILAARPNVKA